MTRHTGSIDALPGVVVENMSKTEGRALLEPRVRDELHISLEDFIQGVDAGEYDDTVDDRVLKLVMLVPFAR